MESLRRVLPVLVVAALLVCGPAGCGSSLERVDLDSGPITGQRIETRTAKIWTFKGIPYAAPPVGELRWRPPEPVASWAKPRACTAFGPSCPQTSQIETFFLDVGATAEDCLYLNVWTPAETGEERLPVMVWIHGGGFETGSGSMDIYSGENLAAKGVVAVTINYRLGPLGFLVHPALSQESIVGISGNYGLLDQIAALEWVKRNIAVFGGDPDNVTIFGESAGAISILDLLVSPSAEGLVARAIVQSGILLDHGFGVSTTATLESGEEAGVAFVEKLDIEGVSDSGSVAESAEVAAQMRAKTAEELLAAAADFRRERGLLEQGLTWKPVADGHVLPALPTTLWAAGARWSVPLLIGSNADEGNTFLAGLTVSAGQYEKQMRAIFGGQAEAALALYPVSGLADVTPALSRMLTEMGFASTARFVARSMSDPGDSSPGSAGWDPQPAPTYLYQFTRVPMGNPMGAFHGVEIPYVFGTADLFAAMGPIEQVDRELSETIMGYWTRFAATGDPNGAGAQEWPRYGPSTDRHLELGDTIRVGSDLYGKAIDLADRVRGIGPAGPR